MLELKTQKENKNHILWSIEEASGVPRELWEFKRTRLKTEVMLRHIYIYMLITKLKMGLVNVATLVGLKNHSTVLQSVNRVKHWTENPDDFQIELEIFYKVLKSYEQRIS